MLSFDEPLNFGSCELQLLPVVAIHFYSLIGSLIKEAMLAQCMFSEPELFDWYIVDLKNHCYLAGDEKFVLLVLGT